MVYCPPDISDLRQLYVYLEHERTLLFQRLSLYYDFDAWKKLAEIILVSVQILNVRKSYEIESITLTDVLNYQYLSASNCGDFNLFAALSSQSQKLAVKYVRFTIGKGHHHDTVVAAVLVPEDLLRSIDLLLKYRCNFVGISDENPYLFAVPGAVLKVTDLLGRFSVLCGAKNPKSLITISDGTNDTEFHKDEVTYCLLLNLQDSKVAIAARDLPNMLRLLNTAQGVVVSEPPVLHRKVEDIEEHDSTDRLLRTSIDHEVVKKYRKNNSKLLLDPILKMEKIVRRPWTEPEKRTVLKVLRKSFRGVVTLPTLQECCDIIAGNPVLQNRTPMQLKAWVNNEIVTKNRLSGGTLSKAPAKRIMRRRWNTNEKLTVFNLFKTCFEYKTLPSLFECQEVIKTNEILQNRTPEQLKAWINNVITKSCKNVTI